MKKIGRLSCLRVSFLTGGSSVDALTPKMQKETLDLFRSGKVIIVCQNLSKLKHSSHDLFFFNSSSPAGQLTIYYRCCGRGYPCPRLLVCNKIRFAKDYPQLRAVTWTSPTEGLSVHTND